jgi:hypothetical protein
MANDQDIDLQQNPEALLPEVIEKLSCSRICGAF